MNSITTQNSRFLKAYYLYDQYMDEFMKQMSEKK